MSEGDKYEESNEMFLAYEVVPVTSEATAFKKPLILDLETVENLSSADKNRGVEYVRGDLLGFCEITRRPYGLGKKQNVIYDDEPATEPSPRPILTNLAVKKKMRKYGVGSKLLDACEQHVAQRWSLDEIILEVEDYNTRALDFYSKRGYELIFDDPAINYIRLVFLLSLRRELELGFHAQSILGHDNLVHTSIRSNQ